MKTFFLYNSLSKTKEEFRSHEKDVVRMYNCGPTVYGPQHIGNLRRYVVSDTLQRVLKWAGYRVESITNITDVGHLTDDTHDSGEDKMLKAAKAEHQDPEAIATRYTNLFFRDLRLLNVELVPEGDAEPRKPIPGWPRATEHISQMLAIIHSLLQSGFAYETSHGIYFHVEKARAYGKLSGNNLTALEAGARIAVDSEKKHPGDFVLWVRVPKEHLMKWNPSDFGFPDLPLGYPGWHIECSAMAIEYLGRDIDIHTGGLDNKFPHHENEIAQSEGYIGHQFVTYWVHNELLLMDGGKMSKSLGNVMLLSDIVQKFVDDTHSQQNVAMSLRLLFLSSHYRSKMSFSDEAFLQARRNLEKIQHFYDDVRHGDPSSDPDPSSITHLQELFQSFERSILDDMNFPEALSTLYELMRDYYDGRIHLTLDVQSMLLEFFEDFQKLSGLQLVHIGIPSAILELAHQLDVSRTNGEYAEADRIRDTIISQGFSVETTPSGTRVFRV